MRKWLITLMGVFILMFSLYNIEVENEKIDITQQSRYSYTEMKPLDLPFEH